MNAFPFLRVAMASFVGHPVLMLVTNTLVILRIIRDTLAGGSYYFRNGEITGAWSQGVQYSALLTLRHLMHQVFDNFFVIRGRLLEHNP